MDSFLDLLNTLIAFATVMLLLALIVTSLVQATQHAFQVRIRNLQKGLRGLLASALDGNERAGGSGTTVDPGELARRVLRSRYMMQGRMGEGGAGADTGGGAMKKLKARLGVAQTSWIEKEELLDVLRRVSDLDEGELAEVERWFGRMEANLCKNFLAMVRWATFAWALAVALVFQVDAFGTLRHLSASAEAREVLAGAAGEVLGQAEEALRDLEDPRSTSEEALLDLEARHPDLEEVIEEASGMGLGREDLVGELRALLEDAGVEDPDTEESEVEGVVKEYRELLGEAAERRYTRAEEVRERAVRSAARFDLAPWPRGRRFFRDADGTIAWVRCLGLLVTVILLSLGAPFWFNQLRNLVNLRDILAPRKTPTGGTPESQP